MNVLLTRPAGRVLRDRAMNDDEQMIEISFYRLRGRAKGSKAVGNLERMMTRGMHLTAIIMLYGIGGSLVVFLLR